MTKKTTLAFILLLSFIISNIYAIVYDFLMYQFNPEFYTKFKFIEYGVAEAASKTTNNYSQWPFNALIQVACMASWWMGAIIGSTLGIIALPLPSAKIMLATVYKAMGIVVLLTFIAELVGLVVAWLFLRGRNNVPGVFYIPKEVLHRDGFIISLTMHHFSYIGAIFGMLAGSIFIIRQKKKFMTF